MYSLGQHPLDQPWVKLVSRPNNWDMGDKGNLVDRTEKRCSWNWGCQGGCFPPSCFRSIILFFGVTAGLGQWGGTWRPLQCWQFGICGRRIVSISIGHRVGWQEILCRDPDRIFLVLANSQTLCPPNDPVNLFFLGGGVKSHFLESSQSLFGSPQQI